MAINDVYEVVAQQTLHAQRVQSVLHYREVDGPAGAGDLDLAAGFAANVVPVWRQVVSAELTYLETIVAKIFPLPRFAVVNSVANAGAGLVAGESQASSVSAVITKRTGLAGPAQRGRVYVAGIPVSFENDSQLNVGGLTAYQDLANELEAAIVSGLRTFAPVIWHRGPPLMNLTTLVSDCLARAVLRNQRRRQIGVGI